MRIFYALLVLLLFAYACEPEDMMSDITPPVIDINDPIDTIFTLSGESIFINGSVTDNLSIDQVSFTSSALGLNDVIMGSEFTNLTGGIISVTIEIDELTAPGNYEIEIKASDIAGNEAVEDIPVVVTN